MPQLKRSQINASIELAIETFRTHHLFLPPFAYWTIEDWQNKNHEYDEIRDCMLGWDVTDFGSGDFSRIGRTLFTLRNGNPNNPKYQKSYAEKLILDPEGQRSPAHFHRSKREDIIHRGHTGHIVLQLCGVTPDNLPSGESFFIQKNGRTVRLEAQEKVYLAPGESLCIPPRTIHQFWGEANGSLTCSGEISSVCDDWNDNYFFEPMCRFPEIEEDEPRRFYLCHEYPICKDAS
jgi:D-lyxose ketol-isomerase